MAQNHEKPRSSLSEKHRNSLTSSATESTIFKEKNGHLENNNSHDSNIWRKMSYVPPRGACGFKYSLVSPGCSCLRFMLHPLKLASSYECDGCGHHASYHQMRSSSEEDAARQQQKKGGRWQRDDGSFDREAYESDEEVQEILAKRRRLGIEGGISSNRDVGMPEKARSTLMETGKKRTRANGGNGAV